MSFKNGDIVMFKSSNLQMVVIDDSLEYKKDNDKPKGKIRCKWYTPNEDSNKDFRYNDFCPEELSLIENNNNQAT